MERTALIAREELENAVDTFNEAVADENSTRGAIADAGKQVKLKAQIAQAAYQFDAYAAICEREFPMLEACKLLTFPTIRLHAERDAATDAITAYSVEDTTAEFAPSVLEAFYKKNKMGTLPTLFSNEKAWLEVQRANKLMTLRLAGLLLGDRQPDGSFKNTKALVDEVSRLYKCSEKIAELDLLKVPKTEKDILALFQRVCDAILFVGSGEKNEITLVQQQDVQYLLNAYTTGSRTGLAIKANGHTAFAQNIWHAMHGALTGTGYTLVYRQKVEK